MYAIDQNTNDHPQTITSNSNTAGTDTTLTNDWQESYNNVAERNAVLLNNGLWSDIEFYFETEAISIPSHRVILAAASNVFAAMAFGDLRTNRISIFEIPSACFMEVLRYVYTDCVHICTENAGSIMYTAHKYNLKSLEEKCIAFIESDMKLDNVCIYFDSLVVVHAIAVKCLKMIKTQTFKVLKTNAFLELDVASLERLLKLDGLNATEVQLYEAMLNWADSACRQLTQTATSANKRILLQNAEQQIRFPTMTIKQFMDCVQMDVNFLTKTEIGELSLGICMAGRRANESVFCGTKRRQLSETDKCNEHFGRPTSYAIETKRFEQRQLDGIELRTKSDVILKGFGVYGMANERSEKLCVTIKYAGKFLKVITMQEIECDGKCKIHSIMLNTPLEISDTTRFSVFIFEFGCEGNYYCQNGSSFNDDFNVLVTKNFEGHSIGRIAEIYFDTKS